MMNTYQVLSLLLAFGVFLITFIQTILKIVDYRKNNNKSDLTDNTTNEKRNNHKK